MRSAALLLLFGLGAVNAGCGPNGSYTLSWFVAGETRSDAYGCSSRGVDGIMVQALKAGSLAPADAVIFPCAPHFGEQKIDAGDYLLQVTPLNPRGERIIDPRTGLPVAAVEVPVTVPAEGTVHLDPVTVAPNPACADGVDNDGDGLIDLADPDCGDALGESEAPPPAQ